MRKKGTNELLILLRIGITIFLFFGSFFAIDMYLTIIKPSRYHLIPVNWVFITLYTIGIICVIAITAVRKDYIKRNVKQLLLCKGILFVTLVMLICDSILLVMLIPIVFETYEEIVEYDPYFDNESWQIVCIFFTYILIILEVTYIYIITRYLPACIKR